MKLIDFDAAFQRYVRDWMRENAAKFSNVDEMEAQMPEVYTRFINEPAGWLGGLAPAFYFDQYDDAQLLLRWMVEYISQGVAVPDQLLERITALGEPAVQPLVRLAADDQAAAEARMTAVGLLRELDSVQPMRLYIGWIAAARELDELCENAAESLKNMGRAVVGPCLESMAGASLAAKECFADILCAFPGEEGVFEPLLALMDVTKNKALIASLLGKLGDERALPRLEQELDNPEINYLDYIEIANAIRELGGEVLKEREFAGDPYYESMKRL